MPQFSVIGAGHIGLPLAIALALRHNGRGREGDAARVLLVDISGPAAAKINAATWPFRESSFRDADAFCDGNPQAALEHLVQRGLLNAAQGDGVPRDPHELGQFCASSAVIFATNTESTSDTHGDYVVGLFRSVVGTLMRQGITSHPLLVMRSTIPPGTMSRLQTVLDDLNLGWPLVYAPERTAEGRALVEILTLPQLIGANTDSAFHAARDVFEPVAPKLIRLTTLEAEYAKLVANSWRYATFGLSNDLFETVERGIAAENGRSSFHRILEAIKLDYPRAANLPAPGFCGGPCLPKDAKMLVAAAGEAKSVMSAAAIETNSARLPQLAVERLRNITGKKVTLLGAAFKPESDDLRASVALEVAKLCLAAGAREVVLHDPLFKLENEQKDACLIKTGDLDRALKGTGGVVVCCPHALYRGDSASRTISQAISCGIPLVDFNNDLGLAPAPPLEIWTAAIDTNLGPGPRKLTVLVTGSAGFIGGYLVDELLAEGYHVIGLDNHSKYGPDFVPKARDSNPNYEFVFGDAKNVELLKKLVARCDYLIAGAAIIGGISLFHARAYDLIAENDRIMAAAYDAAIAVWESQKEAREAVKFDVENNRTALGELDRPLLRKVVVISSSMVFENTTDYPTPEGAQLTSPPPSSTYGFQKLACEYYARGAWEQYGVPFTIVRPFNCVGIGERRAIHKAGAKEIKSGDVTLAMSHVVPDLVQKVLKGQDPLRLLGSGGQVRHYTFGGDLTRGIRMAMEAGKEAFNEDFNLSSAKSTTVLELAEMIWNKCKPGVPFRYESEEPFKYDVQMRVPEASKAKRVLGFEATTSLSDMLDDIIPWIAEQIELGTI